MPLPLGNAFAKKRSAAWATARNATDWMGIWAISLGAIAVLLATFVDVADDNPVAASAILVAVASIIGVGMRAQTAPALDQD
jgi:hypothetical protein